MITKDYVDNRTVYSTIVGSNAYGTNTPESDLDTRGIAIMDDLKYYFGVLDRFEQKEDKVTDTVIYDIRKFFELAIDNNPNILDLLFVEDRFKIKVEPIFEKVLAERDKFISKKVRFSYAGYAVSQLKRIRTARGWLLNPPKKIPERSDFGLPEHKLISDGDFGAFEWVMANLLRNTIEYLNLSETTKTELQNSNWIGLVQSKGTPENCFDAVQKITGASDEWMETMRKEQAYTNAKRHYDSYRNWAANRNKKRAAIEEKFGFDCYSEDTEFLTELGWKKFDSINSDDKLATIVLPSRVLKRKDLKPFSIQYQNYTDKFDALFNGKMYNLFGNHVDTLVTPNHRMLYNEIGRENGKECGWCLEEAGTLPDTFDIVRTITPKTTVYEYDMFDGLEISSEQFMRLMGWFLSDGSMRFKKDKTPKAVAISQKKGGRLCWHMTKFSNQYQKRVNIYTYDRKPNKFNPHYIKEMVLITTFTNVVKKLNECFINGEKRIPRWVFGLSKRMMNMLLDALVLGDGTLRTDNGIIYYSSRRGLADDVQELALMCGYETSLYGPYYNYDPKTMYHSTMHQVHINKTRTQFKRCIRSANIKTIDVVNQRVVCFSVPNSTLITRRNGHIGIHGNCKHATQLVRLLRMCKEILETGKVLVFRPDHEELLAIKNGAWSYEKVEEYADTMEKEVAKLYETSTLPREPNRLYLNNLCIGIIQEYINKG